MYQFFTSDLFGIPVETANWIANGAVALVVLFFIYLFYRMFSRPRMASGRRSKNARLAITDAASIDDRRRIVLVRRDDVEHLIMIGGSNDLVIESDINKAHAGRPAAPLADPSMASPARKPAPPAAPRPAPPAAATNRPPAGPPPRSAPNPAAPAAKPGSDPARSAPTGAVSPPPSPLGSSSSLSSPPPRAPSSPSTPSSSQSPLSASKPADGQRDTSSLLGRVSNKPADGADKSKSSVGDNMESLLTEITTKK